MSDADAPLARDPTLYRVLSFLGWKAADDEQAANRRLARLAAVLGDQGLLPADVKFPSRRDMAWWKRLLAADEEVIAPRWRRQRFVYSQHEEVLLLAGLSEEAACPGEKCDEWLTAAKDFWDAQWPLALRDGVLSPQDQPAAPQDGNIAAAIGDKPRLLGQAWLWTGEWASPPGEGWQAWGRRRYGDECVAFSWGLLGYRAAAETDLDYFELHAAEKAKSDRDRFLFSDLVTLLMSFLKAGQFLRWRYQNVICERLDALERDVFAATRQPPTRTSLSATEQAVRRLANLDLELSQALADLEDNLRGLEIARDTIRDVLDAWTTPGEGPAASCFLSDRVDLLVRQQQSDLHYYRASAGRCQSAIQTHRTLIELERARQETRLVVVGIVLAALVGLGQMLPDVKLLYRLLIWGASAAGVGLAYWLVKKVSGSRG